MAINLRQFIGKYWFIMGMGVVLYLGVHWPETFNLDKRQVKSIVFVIIFLMGLGIPPRELARGALNFKAIGLALSMTYIGAPLLFALLARLVFAENMLAENLDFMVGLMICGAVSSTISSAVVWTRIGGGNVALALILTIFSTCLSALLTPLILTTVIPESIGFTGAALTEIRMQMIVDLCIVILLPVGLAQTTRFFVGESLAKASKFTSILCRLLILTIVCNAVTRVVMQGAVLSPLAIIGLGLLLIIIHFALLWSSFNIAKALRLTYADGVAIMLSSSQKTLPIGLMIAATYFGEYSLAALPMLLYHFLQLFLDTLVVQKMVSIQSSKATA
jgi:solute carrier family 10 (sodium/bile acid cotransporter), member 7